MVDVLAMAIAFDGLRVHPEPGTIVWPGGTDLDPGVLHARLTGKPVAV